MEECEAITTMIKGAIMNKTMANLLYLLAVVVFLGAFALPPQAQGQAAAKLDKRQNGSQWTEAEPAMNGEFTEMLISDLVASGFQVSQGYPALYTQQDCYERTYPILKNCFQANPAAPYVIPVVQSWPDEYVDPASVDAFVETDPGYSATYRLDPREAIVIYGEMPPPGRYMGLQTWEYSEHGQWRPKDYDLWANTPDLPFPIQYLFSSIPPDDPKSHRIITLSSLGDVVNNVVMERQSGYPFGEIRYFIITPSAATDQAIREALQAQGVLNSHIFTEQIPRTDDYGPIGPIGMGKNAIDFITAFRYAVPDADETDAAESWRGTLPLTVLRVRAPDSLGPVQRYGSLTFEPRTAKSEAYLADDLQNLVDEVCDSVSNYAKLTSTDCVQPPPASSFMWELVRDYGWTGPYCRDIGMDCLGDQQEAGLFFSSPRPTGDGQVYAVVATLATETENATYVGLSANDASIMGGVPNGTLLDTQLRGSADVYAPEVANTGKFFVRYFTDNCDVLVDVPGGSTNCTEISGMSIQGDPALQGMIIISLRDYIAPGTTSGPDAAELLTPRILTFTQP
jgi:hypothetical protein